MQEHFDNAEPAYKSIALETVIDELAHYYGVSRQAAKTRMRQLGYNNVDGVYTYVNGHYIPQFSFDPASLGRNQTYTISATDLFKAYCCSKDFKALIDSGKALM